MSQYANHVLRDDPRRVLDVSKPTKIRVLVDEPAGRSERCDRWIVHRGDSFSTCRATLARNQPAITEDVGEEKGCQVWPMRERRSENGRFFH